MIEPKHFRFHAAQPFNQPHTAWVIAELAIMAEDAVDLNCNPDGQRDVDLKKRELAGTLLAIFYGDILDQLDGMVRKCADAETRALLEKLESTIFARCGEIQDAAQGLKRPAADDEIECDHEWTVVDESFDHEFGCEKVVFERCEACGDEREHDPQRFDDDVI